MVGGQGVESFCGGGPQQLGQEAQWSEGFIELPAGIDEAALERHSNSEHSILGAKLLKTLSAQTGRFQFGYGKALFEHCPEHVQDLQVAARFELLERKLFGVELGPKVVHHASIPRGLCGLARHQQRHEIDRGLARELCKADADFRVRELVGEPLDALGNDSPPPDRELLKAILDSRGQTHVPSLKQNVKNVK